MTNPFDFMGLRILETPTRYEPVIKLSDSIQVSDQFREEFNAWLLAMFGKRDVSIVERGTALVWMDKCVIMREEDIVKLSRLHSLCLS